MIEQISIIDAHVHLWNPEIFNMPWLEDVPAIRRPYGLQEYHEQIRRLPIVGMVYVEVGVDPRQALREARHVVELAREEPRLQAIVAAIRRKRYNEASLRRHQGHCPFRIGNHAERNAGVAPAKLLQSQDAGE